MIRDSEEVLRGVEEAWHTARCRGEETSQSQVREHYYSEGKREKLMGNTTSGGKATKRDR